MLGAKAKYGVPRAIQVYNILLMLDTVKSFDP
jgi:hypothetical protein